MKIHSGSKTCPASRVLLVRRVLDGQDRRQVASCLGISLRTVQSWLRRYRREGEKGLLDRSSAPRSSPSRWREGMVHRVIQLRRMGLTGVMVARTCGVPRSTVSRILRRHRLSRRRDIEPQEPIRRYEHEAPGDLLHADIKKLARIGRPGHRIHRNRRTRVRGIGWEYAHVCIDDHSRLAYAEVLADEKRQTTAGFLERAFCFFADRAVIPRRLLTDNGGAYRSLLVRQLCDCDAWSVRHGFTKPYRPCTNGKAERFIQTALREWAYRRPYSRSAQRRLWLPRWLHFYNQHRPHSALDGRPPASRVNNLVTSNS